LCRSVRFFATTRGDSATGFVATGFVPMGAAAGSGACTTGAVDVDEVRRATA
jgi:hypothetical protein